MTTTDPQTEHSAPPIPKILPVMLSDSDRERLHAWFTALVNGPGATPGDVELMRRLIEPAEPWVTVNDDGHPVRMEPVKQTRHRLYRAVAARPLGMSRER